MWIAFIFQYLWDTKQPKWINKAERLSCELLSFFSIFGIQNNPVCILSLSIKVVNCFHFSVSLGYKTTYDRTAFASCWLWIAFIFQYLWDTKQPRHRFSPPVPSCELLSFFSIFGIQNNFPAGDNIADGVVNCFHFSVSLGYKTTIFVEYIYQIKLWIAFIFQYLWDTKQPCYVIWIYAFSCELLSFFSIFGIQNNINVVYLLKKYVVNCFHFSVSLGYKTTKHSVFDCYDALWIAFIFQYLWDTKQRLGAIPSPNNSCELLSFFSIFGIQNNIKCPQLKGFLVVNCFHFSVSLGYKTTGSPHWHQVRQLWIAFIFQYLWDTKQRLSSTLRNKSSCELLSFFSIFGIQNNESKIILNN